MNYLWPSKSMDLCKLSNPEYEVSINWTRDIFTDYRNLSYDFYDAGFLTFKNIIESGHDNTKSDTWFLTGIFLLRHSMELGLKALICRAYTNKSDVQDIFLECKHNLVMIWQKYCEQENHLTTEESMWLSQYLGSLEMVDSKSDIFRFPFEDEFLAQYRDKFIDNVKVANNMLQAFALIKKCINKGVVDKRDAFDKRLPPEFFIMANHGIGNCYLWQPFADDGFYVKVTGYVNVAEFIFANQELSNEKKAFPLFFILRNTIELCLKRIFYSRVENGVSRESFLAKRKSHFIKKDLWEEVQKVVQYYADEQELESSIIDLVEQKLLCIDNIDKKGDLFRYPATYSHEYKFDNKTVDIKNVYEYVQALINFFQGCDTMLDVISDWESDMRSDYGGY